MPNLKRRRKNPAVKLTAEELKKQNPGENLPLLLFGLANNLVRHGATAVGLSGAEHEPILARLENPLADLAQKAEEKVKGMGIDPGLAVMGIMLGVALYQSKLKADAANAAKVQENMAKAENVSNYNPTIGRYHGWQ